MTTGGGAVCVLSAAGRGVSSIAAADLTPYSGSTVRCAGGMIVSAIDLR